MQLAWGILAKYTMIVFLPSLALFLLLSRDHRRLLLFARLLEHGFASCVVCCLPIFIWNARHDWGHLPARRPPGRPGPPKTEQFKSGGLHWNGPVHLSGRSVGPAVRLLVRGLGDGHGFATNPWPSATPGFRFLWWLSAPIVPAVLAFSLKTGGGELNWPVTRVPFGRGADRRQPQRTASIRLAAGCAFWTGRPPWS